MRIQLFTAVLVAAVFGTNAAAPTRSLRAHPRHLLQKDQDANQTCETLIPAEARPSHPVNVINGSCTFDRKGGAQYTVGAAETYRVSGKNQTARSIITRTFGFSSSVPSQNESRCQRHFLVQAGGVLDLRNLELRGAWCGVAAFNAATMSWAFCPKSSCTSANFGGAIRVEPLGTVLLVYTAFSNNVAFGGRGSFSVGAGDIFAAAGSLRFEINMPLLQGSPLIGLSGNESAGIGASITCDAAIVFDACAQYPHTGRSCSVSARRNSSIAPMVSWCVSFDNNINPRGRQPLTTVPPFLFIPHP